MDGKHKRIHKPLKNCKIMAVKVKKATKNQCKKAAAKIKKAAESFKERIKERENETK